jgi:hypothetical protein
VEIKLHTFFISTVVRAEWSSSTGKSHSNGRLPVTTGAEVVRKWGGAAVLPAGSLILGSLTTHYRRIVLLWDVTPCWVNSWKGRQRFFASDRSHPRRLDFSDFIIPFDSSERACTFTYPACNAHAVCLAAPYFLTLSDKRLDFRRSYWTQNVFRFSLLLLFETFLIQRYIVVNVKTSSCKVLAVRIEF